MAVYELQPWGDDRDDIRQEVFRQRLMAGLFGSQGNTPPNATWPYVEPKLTREEASELWEQTEAALKWDGTKYVWASNVSKCNL
jgi:hypothetical protein